MSNNILIHKENDFSSRDISSIPLGNNIIINNNNEKFDLKKEGINNNIRPMLSGSATINIPEGKKIKIKPSLGKKVPLNTFSSLANNKRSNQTVTTEDSSDEDSGTNEILSSNSNNSNFDYTSNTNNDDDNNNNNYE